MRIAPICLALGVAAALAGQAPQLPPGFYRSMPVVPPPKKEAPAKPAQQTGPAATGTTAPAARPAPAPVQGGAADQPPATDPAAAGPAAAESGKGGTETRAAAQPSGGFVLNLHNANIVDVIDILARRLRINYILDPRVKGAVTLNTYGEIRQVDTRSLLETILRINGYALVQVGDIYRILPMSDASRLPIEPQTVTDPKALPEDERVVLNLVFLKYAPVADLAKLLQPFIGEGAQMVTYEPANLVLILDNARNMRRTMEIIGMFDNDALAGQRVRLFDVKNGRPSDLARELESLMKSVSLGEKAPGVRFLPIDRINTIVAISPNPGVFDQIGTWLKRLDIAPPVTAGSVDNYVYRVKYGCADTLASAIMQLYFGYTGFGMGFGMGYGYGMGSGMGNNCGLGMNGMGGNNSGMGGYGGSGYGMSGFGGYGMSPMMMGGYMPLSAVYGGNPLATQWPPAAATAQASQAGSGPMASASGTGAAGSTGTDLTGRYMGSASAGWGAAGPKAPRIIPNPFDNTLLIQATPQDYDQILKLLKQLDVPPRQVLIEAKIYEVNMQGDFESGVQAYLQRREEAKPSGFPASRVFQAASSGGLRMTGGLLVGNSRQLLGIITATEQNKHAKLVSAPSLIATDSIPAMMNVGSDVPTLTAQAVGNVQAGGNSLFTQAISNRQTGATLNVTARVTPSGIVTLRINQEVSTPVAPSAGSAIPSPSFQTRNVTTQVTVQDGDTIAIAGIMSESNTYSSAGIPLLHRIPGIGAAFGGKAISRDRTELVIFITPRVIYDTNQLVDATDELKSGFRKLRKVITE